MFQTGRDLNFYNLYSMCCMSTLILEHNVYQQVRLTYHTSPQTKLIFRGRLEFLKHFNIDIKILTL